MLVTNRLKSRKPLLTLTARDASEHGVALITVLIVFFVVTILALSLGAIVMNTTVSTVHSKDSMQARAAADAGISVAVATAKASSNPCGVAVNSATNPKYVVTTSCASGKLTFTSTGTGATGATNQVQAVYQYTTTPAHGGDMIFFDATTFTAQVLTYPVDQGLLSIVIPSGSFTCQSVIPANIVVAGDIITRGGCDIKGDVISGGIVDMNVGADTIEGNLTTTGAGTNNVQGSIGKNLVTKGGITFGWNSETVGGYVQAGGDVKGGSVIISQTLTLPASATYTPQSATIGNPPVARPVSVTPPTAPTFDPWFEYKFKLSDWQPYEGLNYTLYTVTNCNSWNSSPNTGWSSTLSGFTSPTIVDARGCTKLSSNAGGIPTATLHTNVVLLAKSFDLTQLTVKSAAGSHYKAWFIVEDPTNNGGPTCSGGAGDVKINGTVLDSSVTAMTYTPCDTTVNGMGFDTWTGAFYSGGFNYGGGLSFYGDPIALPGMPDATGTGSTGGTNTLGPLISQRQP